MILFLFQWVLAGYIAGYIHKTLTNKKGRPRSKTLRPNFWLNMLTTKIKNDVDEYTQKKTLTI